MSDPASVVREAWRCAYYDRFYRVRPDHCKRAQTAKEHGHKSCGHVVLTYEKKDAY